MKDDWLDIGGMQDVAFALALEDGGQTLLGTDDLGIMKKEVGKTSPDCGEHKNRGRTPNVEKLNLDGEASRQKKIS